MSLNKYYPLDLLREQILREKDQGYTIALANGCFSLFHIGHIRYLKSSKKMADILVVAVNSDSSIKKIKGSAKIILNQKARITILSSFEFVNYVTLFDEETVDNLLLVLKPDFHCKGSGYHTPSRVPEYETVKSYGGKTLIVGGEKEHSTTNIIRIIQTD